VALPPVEPGAAYAIVDEGPGLSGSSFGAVADALEAQGVAPDRITFLPGHSGELGPEASPRRRERWASARRLHVGFDALIAPQLPAWVEDLTGTAHSIEDVSGGAWRTVTHGGDEALWPPVAAHQERRKFRLHAHGGVFLLKFVGLGSVGLAAYDRARALHDAGFTAKPIGWRHGFLVERWIESRPLTPADAPAFQCALARYLAFRATAFPTDAPGADPAELAEMLRVNVVEGLGERWADRLPATPTRLRAAVIGDHRLHAWEWRVLTDGRIIKTDAVDHALAHDLIGPQPPDWDLAGALVEHGLKPVEPLDPFWPAAYAGFQLGLWRLGADALAGWPSEAGRCARQSERYAAYLRRALA
jgi:hypothetical protein